MPSLPKIRRSNFLPLLSTLVLILSVWTGVTLVQQQQELRTKAAGNTYYVAKTSCSDGYPGIEGQPWCTIQKAAETMGAGDTVYVKKGNYPERVIVNNSGSGGNLINFKVFGNDNVKMKGFEIYGDYIHIEGFEITDTPAEGKESHGILFDVKGNNSEIVDNYIHHLGGIGIKVDHNSPYPDNVLIKGNTINFADMGIRMYGDNYLIEGNDISRVGDFMRLWGNGHKIINNYFHHAVQSDYPGSHIDIFQTYNSSGDPLTDLLIENNFVYNIAGGNSHIFMAQGDGHSNWTIRNNVFAKIGSYGFILQGPKDVKIINNTIMDIGMEIESPRAVTFGYGATGGKVVNNIFYNTRAIYWVSGDSKPGFQAGYNLDGTDPKFVDYANQDFHLRSNSPAIDAGDPGEIVAPREYDIEGNTTRGRVDIGAYEYTGGVQPSPPSPSPGPSTPTPVPTAVPGCHLSKSSWQNFSISPQTGTFSVEFDAIPNSQGIDALTALSSKSGSTFDDYAAIVRFNTGGTIDVRNGGTYTADSQIFYTAGTSYHFRIDVNIPARTYSVWVTPQGGTTQLVASNYAFRSTQNNISNVSNWGLWAGIGSAQVCNFTLASVTPTPTPTPLPGDINGDGVVNILDFQVVSNDFGSSNPNSDLNQDGVVNILDFQILSNNFGRTSG